MAGGVWVIVLCVSVLPGRGNAAPYLNSDVPAVRRRIYSGFTPDVSLTITAEHPHRSDLGVGKEKHAIFSESLIKQMLLLG